jgi:integrase
MNTPTDPTSAPTGDSSPDTAPTAPALDPALLDQLAVALGRPADDIVAVLAASASAPIVAKAVKGYLTVLTERTRTTYGTPLQRIVNGFGPFCDQLCAPCLVRANDFTCQCACAACSASRITIPALGAMRVSKDVFTADLVVRLAAVSQRHALKKGIIDNRARAERGKPPKRGDGHNAAETAIRAMRSLYTALEDHCDPEAANKVKPQSRNPREKRPMRPSELVELHVVTASGGDDPELDVLLLDTGIATGARIEGLERLTLGQLHRSAQTIDMKDKGNKTVAMPVSVELIDRLLAHAKQRGGAMCDPASTSYRPDAPVFWLKRTKAGEPRKMSGRRFDTLANRWQSTLDWAMEEQLGFHHIRHAMGAILASNAGPQYKKRYLRHADTTVSDVYGICNLEGLARAMSRLLEFEHPLVHGLDDRDRERRQRLGLD